MKKVLLILVGIVCTLSASALSYASPYKGAGRNGYIHTSAPMRSSMGTRAVMAQAPVAAMSSTSSYGTQYMPSYAGTIETSSNNTQVRGIYTAASAVQGGITTCETHSSNKVSGKRKNTIPGHPEVCEHCHWEYIENYYGPGMHEWVCSSCGATLRDNDCTCEEESGYCWCPLDLNWSVMLFFAALAVAYEAYKKRTSTVQ